jgi:hypothetical protein
VPATGIQTRVVSNAAVIQVPSGQRLRLLDGSYPLSLIVTLTNGAYGTLVINYPQSSAIGNGMGSGICNPEGFEIAGPLTVALNASCFITYFFASDITQVVGQAIQSPAGSIVTVEKSIDLHTWYPAYVTTEKSAPKAFYRLSIAQ